MISGRSSMMKKYIIGFLSGTVLSLTTVAFASGVIQVSLFPSKVKFHVNNTVKEIDGLDILNYNNRIYIPLRSFSETIGSSVNFQPASKDTENVNLIDIYSSGSSGNADHSDQIQTFSWKDPNGYVSVGDLNVTEESPYGNTVTSGTIQINKDLTGKRIDMELYDKTGEGISCSEFVYIDNQDIQPPQPGDIRSFKTDMSFDKGREIGSCKITVSNILKPIENEYINKQNGDPIAILFSPPSAYSFDTHSIAIGDIHVSTLQLYNSSENTITVDPINFEFAVYKVDDEDTFSASGEPVYTYKLPVISGPILSKAGYEVKIPWNQRGLDGNMISEGKYVVELKLTPHLIQYTNEGSKDIQFFDFEERKPMQPGHRYGVFYSAN